MIKRNKLKKLLFNILLIQSLLTIEINYVGAACSGLHCTEANSLIYPLYNPVDNTEGTSNSGTPTYGSQCNLVSCKVDITTSSKIELHVDVKKEDGTIEKLENLGFASNFLAGTSVMLRVYEEQSFVSTAKYSVSAKRQMWNCRYFNWDACASKHPLTGRCEEGWVPAGSSTEECSCSGSGGYVLKFFAGWKDVTSEYISSCSKTAVPEEFALSPSYRVIYEDSNDIDAKESTDKYYTATKVEGYECEKPVKGKKPGKYESDGYTSANTLSGKCSISYDRKGKICINVKNGKVRYINEKDNCTTTEEYTITPDEDGFWKYFIPLNANSTHDFKLSLAPGTYEKKTAEHCQNAIEKYDDYPYRITLNPEENTFVGLNITKKKAKQMVKNGCYFKMTINIPVVQKFYNELDNGINFKGFNFYYKPIDINNPFPNGLTDTSLWYDWNEAESKNPDISKSYNQKTYIAKTSGNESDIRTYSKYNPYTSWENMNVEGYSYFIKDKGIVEKIDKTSNNDYYPLGCGPWNEKPNNEDGSKNYFYQPECDNS